MGPVVGADRLIVAFLSKTSPALVPHEVEGDVLTASSSPLLRSTMSGPSFITYVPDRSVTTAFLVMCRPPQ